MMKVLLLNGSANKKGNTFTALTEIAKQLEKNGVESEIMQLGNKPVRGCIACGQCQMKQLGRCVAHCRLARLLWSAQRSSDGRVATCLLLRCKSTEQTSSSCCRMSSWWCYGSLSDAEHDIRDDEHARGDLAILEHCLRPGTR